MTTEQEATLPAALLLHIGTGKTHIHCAVGNALFKAGHRVFYTWTGD